VLTVEFVTVAYGGEATAAHGGEATAMGVRPGGVLLPAAQEVNGVVARALANRHRFKGEEGDVLSVLTPDGWIILVGMGHVGEQDARRVRRIGGSLFAGVAASGIVHLQVALDLDPGQAAELAYGIMLRAWRPAAHYRSTPDPDEAWSLTTVSVVTTDPAAARARFARLAPVARASAFARDLVAAPANELSPRRFIKRLASLRAMGVGMEVIRPRHHGLRLLQAVGAGSRQPARLVLLRWQGGRRDRRPVVFVGKGITFDSGGIGIKPSQDMEEMKGDMAGAAAVAGALGALAERRAAVNAVGVLAIAENMPSGGAVRPGDVVTSYAGLSVEIVDTDAEGRLVLADALAYAAALCRPSVMIDLATLTGAVEVALGRHRAGLFTTDDGLAGRLSVIGNAEDELLWRLPLTEDYDEALKSPVADLRNCEWDRGPDALHAARFLQHFVPKGVPWAHLDIAGLSTTEEDGPLAGKGPTGFGVRLLDRLADFYGGAER
jgi:leucyl aminopeptidase